MGMLLSQGAWRWWGGRSFEKGVVLGWKVQNQHLHAINLIVSAHAPWGKTPIVYYIYPNAIVLVSHSFPINCQILPFYDQAVKVIKY